VLPSRRCAHELAQRPRDPPLPSDHLADVVLRHIQPEHHDVVPLLALDANRAGVVHEPPRERLEELVSQCSGSSATASRARSAGPLAYQFYTCNAACFSVFNNTTVLSIPLSHINYPL